MVIDELARPADLDTALDLVRNGHGIAVGGGLWLRMSAKRIKLAVDLSCLGLEYIRESGGAIEIGAMTSFRTLETSPFLAERFGMFFRSVLGGVVGVQFRNMASVGGTVAGRYAFSGLNTAFAALGAQVVLRGEGGRDIGAFLAETRSEAFLVEKIAIPSSCRAGYSSIALTKGDFCILTAAAVFRDGAWRVAVGARPGVARLCVDAMKLLGSGPRPSSAAVEKAADAAALELEFSDDMRASAEYRRAVCPVLVRRAISEAVS